jgi:RNA polymerase sigma-70 factor (ECF subfamily)
VGAPTEGDAAPPHDAGEDAVSRALDAVLARFTAAARALARRAGLAPDDLDDLLQEVRIRLWRSLGTAERLREVRALYVRRAVASAAIDLLRRRRARRELPLDRDEGALEPAARDTADAAADGAELDAAVARAVDGLIESRRAVVRLYLAGYPREEIAEMLGWSEAKTRNLLYRGLDDLRAALERAGITTGGSR